VMTLVAVIAAVGLSSAAPECRDLRADRARDGIGVDRIGDARAWVVARDSS